MRTKTKKYPPKDSCEIVLKFRVKKTYVFVENQKLITWSSSFPFLEICYGFFTILQCKFVYYVTRNLFAPPYYLPTRGKKFIKHTKVFNFYDLFAFRGCDHDIL